MKYAINLKDLSTEGMEIMRILREDTSSKKVVKVLNTLKDNESALVIFAVSDENYGKRLSIKEYEFGVKYTVTKDKDEDEVYNIASEAVTGELSKAVDDISKKYAVVYRTFEKGATLWNMLHKACTDSRLL